MNLNDNRLIIKTLKSGDQKVFSLVYASYYKPLCFVLFLLLCFS